MFQNGFGFDIITDFDDAWGYERLDFSAHSDWTDFADVTTNHVFERNGDLVFFDDSGDELIVKGYQISDISTSWFEF